MSAGTLISLEEYLSTSYSPDKEYCDGVLVERNVGDNAQARLQALLAAYLIERRKQWRIAVYTELRIKGSGELVSDSRCMRLFFARPGGAVSVHNALSVGRTGCPMSGSSIRILWRAN